MSELVWRDLRDWIGAVEHLGELRHVEGASWEWDIGAVTELLDHTPEAPAALFRNHQNHRLTHRTRASSLRHRTSSAAASVDDPSSICVRFVLAGT